MSEIKLAAADARTFLGDTKGIVADVKSGKGTLGMLLYDETTANNVKVTTTNLRELSEKLNSGQGTFGIYRYSGLSPFGFNGRYIYARLAYSL